MKNVLVLCTGNSARSILGEALLNRLGEGRIRAFSAGSNPKGQPHRGAISLLHRKGHDVSGLRSKKWDEFARPDAPTLDIVITVCDNAAGEACPVWPGAPVSAHWGIEDPADAAPEAEEAAFERAYGELEQRVGAFLALDFEAMPAAELRAALNAIGAQGEGATDMARAGG